LFDIVNIAFQLMLLRENASEYILIVDAEKKAFVERSRKMFKGRLNLLVG